MRCGKGVSSRTPSLRVSAQRVRALWRGCRVRGRVVTAVRRVGYCRRSALRPWKKAMKFVGWAECGGYSAGERIVGITSRCTVEGDEFEIALLMESRMDWKGEPERESWMWLTFAPDGRVRRFVRSKVWEKGVSG